MRHCAQHIQAHRGYYWGLAVAAFIFLLMNALTTMKGDEYVFSLMPGDMSRRCATLADYVRSIPFFFIDNDGRVADMAERFTISLLGKPVFNVMNTLIFIIFVELIHTLAACRRSVASLAAVAVALLFFFPYPGETMMWMAGSFNYLWSVTLTLCLLWLLLLWRGRANSGWRHVVVCVAAFVAGGFNEATSTAFLAGLALWLALHPKDFRSVMGTAFVGYLAGLLLIMASPALWARLAGGHSVNLNLSLWQMASRRVLMLGYMTLRFITPLAAWGIVLTQWRQKGWPSVKNDLPICLLAGATVAALTFGMVIERPYSFYVSLAMVIVLRWAGTWLATAGKPQRILMYGLCVTAFTASLWYLPQIRTYQKYDRQVIAAIQSGPKQCILPARQSPVRCRWIVPDVYDNEQYHCAYRAIYAKYFGKDNVQFLPQPLYARYVAGQLLDGAIQAPFVSSDTTTASTVWAIPGQPYALIAVNDTTALGDGYGKLLCDNAEQVWGDAATRRKLIGTYLDYIPFRPYYLLADGKPYFVVTGELTDHVKGIEMSLHCYGDWTWRDVTFTRPNAKKS